MNQLIKLLLGEQLLKQTLILGILIMQW